MNSKYPILSPKQAANLINDGQIVAFSGFTAAGAPKVISKSIAARARKIHEEGNPFKIGVITGASTGKSLDGELAKADAILFRTPYQSDPDLRRSINEGKTTFYDMHLSVLPQAVRYGFLGKISWAIIEACHVSEDGEITLTSAVGASPTFCNVAEKILIELNSFHPAALKGFHDIYETKNPPHRLPIPLLGCRDRIGTTTIKVDPKKIQGIVLTNAADEVNSFSPINETTAKIGKNVAEFLAAELKRGLIPKEFLPIQSGVGDTANAVLKSMGEHPDLPAFEMYTEVIQDAVIDLIKSGRITFASGCSLTVSEPVIRDIYSNLEFYRSRLMLRPQEITNSPEIVRRIGIISINTAIEVDITGNVNSTHVFGRNLMNGIGGSGDFARNAYLSIFTCPSTAKHGKISTIVPMVSHLDSSEHSVQIIVTEQGVADLRGKSPAERARIIIDNCVHPDYKRLLNEYVALAGNSHSPELLHAAFAPHISFEKTGDMRNVRWSDFTI